MTQKIITLTVDDDYTVDRLIKEMQRQFGPEIDKEYIADILYVDFSRLSRGDSIVYTFETDDYADGGEIAIGVNILEVDSAASSPPMLGKLLLCLLLSPEKQDDRLADFEERLTTRWIPEFGPRIGRLIYIWHALRSAGAIVRIGLAVAIADRLARKFGL